jgi:hypothetical protein
MEENKAMKDESLVMFPAIAIEREMKFPRMVRIERNIPNECYQDVEYAVATELLRFWRKFPSRTLDGKKIAVAVGSRGIANLASIIKAVTAELKNRGATPIIVPAMGSHGGGTAQGQLNVLKEYGITEASVNAQIHSSIDVIEIGKTKSGVPVFFDDFAMKCDCIVPINRIKKHTDFTGRIESGLLKMLAIGLGHEIGAATIHQQGVPSLSTIIQEAAELIISRAPIYFGIGIVENGHHNTAKVRAIAAKDFKQEEEKLLRLSNMLLEKVPLDADVLIVDQIGKDISGCGMDTNAVGRIGLRGIEDPRSPNIFRIVVLDLTDKSEGNPSGIGIADFTTKKVIGKINFSDFYINEVASGMSERGKIPMAFATDRDAIKAALLCCWGRPTEKMRVLRIKNTNELSTFFISEELVQEATKLSALKSIGQAEEFDFDSYGSIKKGW